MNKRKKLVLGIMVLVTVGILCACGKGNDIELTTDNYETYLNFSCNQTLSGAIDYGEAMGSSACGVAVYTEIDTGVSVSGKSTNYDYNDVVVTVKITGYYVPFSEATRKSINRGEITLEDYYKSNMEPVSETLTVSADIVGDGSDESVISIPADNWVMDSSVQLKYEVVEVSGTMSPVK